MVNSSSCSRIRFQTTVSRCYGKRQGTGALSSRDRSSVIPSAGLTRRARGYVTRSIRGPELVAAIEKVASGDAVFSPKLAGFVLDAFTALTPADADDELASLSAREREVLQHIARGYTYRETGEALFISVKTVETHVGSVLRKLQLTNRNG
jgi:DNA-binding NarL/FixJ family response regulator